MTKREEMPLSFTERFLLAIHTAMCGLCSLFGKQSSFISEHAHKIEAHADDVTMSETRKAAIVKALN